MRTTPRASSRALLATATAGVVLSMTLTIGTGTAAAHVHVDADDAAPGSTSVLTFRVPGESEDGSLTTKFSVALPNVASARTEVMPGWSTVLDRDATAGTVRSVTWTAAPGVGISAEQFALFHVSVALPDEESVSLPATQTYSDGKVVRWDQPPLPGGGEPEYPAPTLELSGAAAGGDEHGSPAPTATAVPSATEPQAEPVAMARPDDTARWLAGGALVLAAVAVVLAVVRRRSA
ncbi:YcnI family protein [Mycolicibacterium sediminis]|uniref:YncI copper-binding domain-containing protein n=1 Tax=Mycolicibacterium sediminis TaxID=1286180 RepID=A0A7I7QJX7_9MYCO|nr:YcnI family protein [Mycolicibacterium sediminis]BBY26584.1 hypothetical protein MSEDJ_06800 [Mycolicibacterium sediminis]